MARRMTKTFGRAIATVAAMVAVHACGDDGGGSSASAASDITADKDPSISSAGDGVHTGILDLAIDVHESIMGVAAGDLTLQIADGWTVTHDVFLATFGGLEAVIPAMSYTARAPESYVIDLIAAAPRVTTPLRVMDAQAGMYTAMALAMPVAAGTAACVACSGADQTMLEKGGYSLYVEGSVTSDAGQSCSPDDPKDCVDVAKVVFRWGIPVGTDFDGCPGFPVIENETHTVDWEIRGDRWLRVGFGATADMLPRQAQWIADADLDRDGETTLAELQQIKAEVLFSADRGYDLADAPIPVDTAYDFLIAQVHTIGLANGCVRATPTQ